MKTEPEIEAEINALEALQPHVGEENHARLAAQIQALRDRMGEDDIAAEWEIENHYTCNRKLINAALDAIGWRDSAHPAAAPSQRWVRK